MANLHIDGVEVLTLPAIAELAGLTVEALRQRVKRGTFPLVPHASIGGQHFYDAEHVRASVRRGLCA